MRLNASDIAAMPSRRRAALVNSLSGYKSANLVGTTDSGGNLNLSMVSSVVHLGSHPPLLAMIIRPGGEERHTLANLLSTGQYSINHVNESIIEAAHQTAARYPRAVSEFSATGLTPQWWQGFKAPLVDEANIKLALQLREHRELDINGTHLVIGEIVAAQLPDAALRDDGAVQLHLGGTVALSGLDSYYRPGLLKRMAYAKPDLPPRQLHDAAEPAATSAQALTHRLLSSQVQCVLSTHSADAPRQHLMAYAFDDSLRNVYLASRPATEKVTNMLRRPQVSLLWDNRTGNTTDHCNGVAAMAAGRAAPVRGWQRARAAFLLLQRNPELEGLLASADTLVLAVAVDAYRLARGYDAVAEFSPHECGGVALTALAAQAGQMPSRRGSGLAETARVA
jgi:flavin reductase (DIM6/NTAB) family NADH-FMN oxidoreductase RutF/nitroimidazol reductase NimA-like FMN-containing flavoprotein (pyridoxamine 5'-phosphate oxidase superfamily)